MSHISHADGRVDARHAPSTRARHPIVASLAIVFSVAMLVTAMSVQPAYGATPTLAVAPDAAPVGTYIVVTGSGFPAKARVQLTWDKSASGMPATQANRQGTFTITVRIPASSSGSHEVDAVERLKVSRRGSGRSWRPTTLS